METIERIRIVSSLQNTSAEVFQTVMQSLKVGMSEIDVAEAFHLEFKKKGIKEFWYYQVPQNILIGVKRFQEGIVTPDYTFKSPSEKVLVEEGSLVFADLSPMDPQTQLWGDWASMAVFHPRDGDEQVEFLEEFRNIHRKGLTQITAQTTGADVISYYVETFHKAGITPLWDIRKNVGHSLHAGPKDETHRIWLDENNPDPLGESVFAVEPCGLRQRKDGKGIVIARFEESIYIPKDGNAIILRDEKVVPVIF